jgi:hypothetical protein
MTIQDLGAIGELIAAVATVGTLIYLSIQIRQNTKAIAGASIDAITNHTFQELRWSAEIDDLMFQAQENPESLSELERRQVVLWGLASLRNRQNEYFQWKQGSLSDEVWKASESILPGILGNPVLRQWFDSETPKHVLAEDFYTYAKSLTEEAEQSFVQKFGSFGSDEHRREP